MGLEETATSKKNKVHRRRGEVMNRDMKKGRMSDRGKAAPKTLVSGEALVPKTYKMLSFFFNSKF